MRLYFGKTGIYLKKGGTGPQGTTLFYLPFPGGLFGMK